MPHPRIHRSRQLPPPALVLALALCLTVIATIYVARVAAAKDRERFDNSLQVTRDSIEVRIETYVNALRHTAALFQASEELRRSEFRSYVKALGIQERYSGILGVGFARRVGPEGAKALEAQERRERAGFRVFPDGRRPEMTPIVWLEPEEGRNLRAIGYDMFSDPVRRAAMERARDTGEPAASGPVVLVQETNTDRQVGFLIYVPVYERGANPQTVEARRRALIGYVYSPFRTGDLFEGIFGTQQNPRLEVEIFDAKSPDLPLRHEGAPRPGYRPRLRESRTLGVSGREWTLTFSTRPQFESSSTAGTIPLVAIGGVIISLLLFAVTLGQSQARVAAERMTAEVQESEEALRQANQAKDEFLAMLGHELRNPLAAIKNSLEVLKLRLAGDSTCARALEIAERQLRHQTRLVEDLLDVSRVTSGKIELRLERLDLRDVARHAVEAQRLRLEERRHQLGLDLGSEPIYVEGDPVRLEQVVGNLLTNAIKYTPAGGQIQVRACSEDGNGVIQVRDNGVGIPPPMLGRIFELFAQAPSSVARSDGGMGLGLTLVRALVHMHGGDVSAASEGPGKGTELTVQLPLLTTPEPSGSGAPATEPATGRRVVVVEDNPDARETLLELLEIWGHRVETAEDGSRGLDLILETQPEVALVDIGLPGLDGYEVARRVRSAGLPTRLVAVTGYGQPEDRRRTAEAGFDIHLVKPVDLETLAQVLGKRDS